MTLRDVTILMNETGAAQPAVRTVVPLDIFRLNTMPDVLYGVFAWTQGQHRLDIAAGLARFAFTLFYVDRVDEARDNEIIAQSAGVSTLANIIRVLDASGVEIEGEAVFQPFTQRFSDDCAGVFTNVTFLVPLDTTCAEDYESNEDDE